MRKYFSVLIGGVTATGLCYVWYSRALFQEAWLRGQWITSAKIAAQMETGLWDTWLFTGFAFILLSFGIHFCIAVSGSHRYIQKLCMSLLLWSLIATPILFLDFLWEFRRTDLLMLDGLFLLMVFLWIAHIPHWLKTFPR